MASASAELCGAPCLGPAGAANLMEAVRSRPGSSAVALFPQAAAANKSIFYRDGRPVTVVELRENLSKTAGGPSPVAPADPEAMKDAALAARLDRLRQDQSVLKLLLGQNDEGGDFLRAFGVGKP